MAIKNVVGALLLASIGLVGCDQSKAELDSTKQQLTSVTAERDSLKTQLDATKAQLAAAQQQLDQMKQAAATPPPTAPTGAPAAPAHHAKGGEAERRLRRAPTPAQEVHEQAKKGHRAM